MSQVVGASVDVGSNSVHLLVARVDDHQLRSLADESAFLGLGARVAEDGLLGATARAELAEAVAGYVATARSLGATTVTVVGTEPIRRAADGPAIVAEVGRAAGVPLHVLTHEEEAYLTVIGVTEGRLRRARGARRRRRRWQLGVLRRRAGRSRHGLLAFASEPAA